MGKFDFTNQNDFDDDDYEAPHSKYILGQKIDFNKYSKDNQKTTPLISYDYIILDNNLPHSFDQACIDHTDILKYFQILKRISSTIIDDVIDKAGKDLHFHIYQPDKINKKLRELITAISGKILDEKTMPSVGQFALYTSTEMACRTSNIKSPRIYFMLVNATFYILFYDPYHEINPGK